MSIADKLTTIADNVQKVYEAGKAQGGGGISEELMSTLWSAITGQSLARDYTEVFMGLDFDNATYKPIFDLSPTIATSMFESCSVGLEEEKQVDCIEYEPQAEAYMDFYLCEKVNKAFYKCGLFKTLGTIDLRNVTASPVNCFSQSTIQKIEAFYPPDLSMKTSFVNTSKLTYIGVESTVTNSISLQYCPLENESAILFIQHLKNYAGTDSAFVYTLTFSDEVWARLDALGNVSPNGNTWKDYCNDIGWNT